mmetsp:Transcript_54359/g.116072  ORF Transcript_54359/g.116072 Transcript_54359/m.116072 type:complete len:351 (-) Transcript_54359:169-1221(-)
MVLAAATSKVIGRCASSSSLLAKNFSRSSTLRLLQGGRTFTAAALQKVAFIQDQQIPRPDAEAALSGEGFSSQWCLDGPSDAWGLVTVTTPVTEEILDQHPNCKVVAVSFTGFNHVDMEACRKRGISVVNVPAYSTDAVAELTVGLAVTSFREVVVGDRAIREGKWVISEGGLEICNKTVGIVGIGAIGNRTAELFSAFRAKEILGWSRSPKPDFIGRQVDLETVFKSSDIVSVHVPLNAETQGMIGRDLLQHLKPDSVLINVARGGVVDQTVLTEMLCERRFRAALDVFEKEPLSQEDPLVTKVPPEQVVLIPHVGYKSKEALQRRIAITAGNLRAFADGKPRNLVSTW